MLFFAVKLLFLKMRHDLLGADIQMLDLVEQRVEDDLLRAAIADLLNFLGALGCATPDRNLWTEVGIFIAFAEPFADAPLGARFIVVDGEINPFGEVKCRRVAIGLREHVAKARRLADKRS
jgi:hypothetical protein